MEELFKTFFIGTAIIFFLLGSCFFTIELETTKIMELRYCPHCSKEILR